MARKRLSSAQTFFIKFVFPAIWIGGFGLGTIMLFVGGDSIRGRYGQPPPPMMPFVFLGAWVLGSAFISWSCIRLKRVDMDEHSLFLSNYREEVEVPLHDVVLVSENPWINSHPVTIVFRRPTRFGDRIVFMPKLRLFGLWSSHPVVDEIRQAAARALFLTATASRSRFFGRSR